ncbi:endoglucanase [Solidesulfovibrio fructosivorans JJ]]|uniref:Endoglucanase n=1 Tax=Solidesulfovibrio fructosivorans JJ] TaxID=596151 RepID=E1JSV1_SOLFR|nr:glycosyl hydrolase [Solidesulfovibrio fructosivorans]EFL52584.1 endoglucanase [Solidesulfovibrio fructosivorans JJ]]
MAKGWVRGLGSLILALAAMAGGYPLSTCAASKPNFGFVLDGYPIDPDRLAALRRETGVAPSMITFFLQWPRNPAEGHFPLASVKAISDAGAIACITWEPMYILDGQEHMIKAMEILAGRYDPLLDAFARGARLYGKLLVIRFAHEMNLERYHWGGPRDGYGPQSPALYREMFRYVVKRFRVAKATNVLFAFCPNAESLPHPQRDNAHWNEVSAYYPGDDVVDLMGMDGYNWGTTQTKANNGWDSAFRSFADIFGPVHKTLDALAPGKPLLVFEMSSAAAGGDKAAWLREALETAASWNVAALNWFQADKEVDWRLGTGLGLDLPGLLQAATTQGAGSLAVTLRHGERP